jgi:hypothetical protein
MSERDQSEVHRMETIYFDGWEAQFFALQVALKAAQAPEFEREAEEQRET